MVGVEHQRRNDRASSYCTLWLDANVNQGEENLLAQERLRMFVKYLFTFDDQQHCLEYIQSLSSEYQIILIVSGQLGNSIVSEICHLQKVLAIYVYCSDKKQNELWARHYFKVIEHELILNFFLLQSNYPRSKVLSISSMISSIVFDHIKLRKVIVPIPKRFQYTSLDRLPTSQSNHRLV